MAKESDNINYSKEEQGEFFSEFRASGGNKFAYLKKEMSLGKKMVLSVSYESLVLFFIALIMLVVVFFSLGVEKGKRVAVKNMRTWATTYANRAAKKVSPAEGEAAIEQSAAAAGEKNPSINYAEQSTDKPYAIQIMAVKKIEEAQKETARLNGMGYTAFIIQSSAWYHVCVGRYATIAEANNNLPAIKGKYPNCYIRKIKK